MTSLRKCNSYDYEMYPFNNHFEPFFEDSTDRKVCPFCHSRSNNASSCNIQTSTAACSQNFYTRCSKSSITISIAPIESCCTSICDTCTRHSSSDFSNWKCEKCGWSRIEDYPSQTCSCCRCNRRKRYRSADCLQIDFINWVDKCRRCQSSNFQSECTGNVLVKKCLGNKIDNMDGKSQYVGKMRCRRSKSCKMKTSRQDIFLSEEELPGIQEKPKKYSRDADGIAYFGKSGSKDISLEQTEKKPSKGLKGKRAKKMHRKTPTAYDKDGQKQSPSEKKDTNILSTKTKTKQKIKFEESRHKNKQKLKSKDTKILKKGVLSEKGYRPQATKPKSLCKAKSTKSKDFPSVSAKPRKESKLDSAKSRKESKLEEHEHKKSILSSKKKTFAQRIKDAALGLKDSSKKILMISSQQESKPKVTKKIPKHSKEINEKKNRKISTPKVAVQNKSEKKAKIKRDLIFQKIRINPKHIDEGTEDKKKKKKHIDEGTEDKKKKKIHIDEGTEDKKKKKKHIDEGTEDKKKKKIHIDEGTEDKKKKKKQESNQNVDSDTHVMESFYYTSYTARQMPKAYVSGKSIEPMEKSRKSKEKSPGRKELQNSKSKKDPEAISLKKTKGSPVESIKEKQMSEPPSEKSTEPLGKGRKSEEKITSTEALRSSKSKKDSETVSLEKTMASPVESIKEKQLSEPFSDKSIVSMEKSRKSEEKITEALRSSKSKKDSETTTLEEVIHSAVTSENVNEAMAYTMEDVKEEEVYEDIVSEIGSKQDSQENIFEATMYSSVDIENTLQAVCQPMTSSEVCLIHQNNDSFEDGDNVSEQQSSKPKCTCAASKQNEEVIVPDDHISHDDDISTVPKSGKLTFIQKIKNTLGELVKRMSTSTINESDQKSANEKCQSNEDTLEEEKFQDLSSPESSSRHSRLNQSISEKSFNNIENVQTSSTEIKPKCACISAKYKENVEEVNVPDTIVSNNSHYPSRISFNLTEQQPTKPKCVCKSAKYNVEEDTVSGTSILKNSRYSTDMVLQSKCSCGSSNYKQNKGDNAEITMEPLIKSDDKMIIKQPPPTKPKPKCKCTSPKYKNNSEEDNVSELQPTKPKCACGASKNKQNDGKLTDNSMENTSTQNQNPLSKTKPKCGCSSAKKSLPLKENSSERKITENQTKIHSIVLDSSTSTSGLVIKSGSKNERDTDEFVQSKVFSDPVKGSFSNNNKVKNQDNIPPTHSKIAYPVLTTTFCPISKADYYFPGTGHSSTNFSVDKKSQNGKNCGSPLDKLVESESATFLTKRRLEAEIIKILTEDKESTGSLNEELKVIYLNKIEPQKCSNNNLVSKTPSEISCGTSLDDKYSKENNCRLSQYSRKVFSSEPSSSGCTSDTLCDRSSSTFESLKESLIREIAINLKMLEKISQSEMSQASQRKLSSKLIKANRNESQRSSAENFWSARSSSSDFPYSSEREF